MTNKKKILVFTATYNERDNIVTLIYSILNNCPYADILIIDDNSPDKTFEKVQELQSKYKNIFLLNRKLKLGLDTAHKKAYDYTIENNYDILIKTKGYSFFMETLFEIANHGFQIKEIPITFKDRVKGSSKIPKAEVFRTLINLFILFFKKKLKK